MLNQNYTAKLLDLEDVNILNVENFKSGVHIRFKLPRKQHICPYCGAQTERVLDNREKLVKDFLWAVLPVCTFISAGTAAWSAASALQNRILSFLVTRQLPAD